MTDSDQSPIKSRDTPSARRSTPNHTNVASLIPYRDNRTLKCRLQRAAWVVCSSFIFRPLPDKLGNRFRLMLLRRFGAVIGKGCRVSNRAKIFAPWNMTLGQYCCIGGDVDFYCVGPIRLGDKVTISQRAFVCTASHDIGSLERPLTVGEIEIGSFAWICAQASVMPNVRIGEGAVVGLGSVVTRAVEPWQVVAGNPAKVISCRRIESAASNASLLTSPEIKASSA